MKRILSLFGVLVVLFVTLWFLLYLYERVRFVITDNAYQYADIVDVSTEDVSGYIVELYKREFEAVKKGEPLFKVDDSTLKRELSALNEELKALISKKRELREKLSRLREQLPEEVRASELQVESLKGELLSYEERLKETEVKYSVLLKSARASLSAAQKSFEASKVNLERMERKFKRYGELYRRRVISSQQFEDVKSAYYLALSQFESSRANLEVAREKLKEAEAFRHTVNSLKAQILSIRKKLGVLKSQLSVRKADLRRIGEIRASVKEISHRINSLKEKVEKLKILISHTLVRAPISGLIAKRWKERGDYVSPGLPVYSIYDPNHFYVLAWVDESDIGYVESGEGVEVKLETCEGSFKGRVISVGTSAGSVFALIPRDTSQGEYVRVTQRVPVKIRVFNVPLKCIKPGTNASVKISKD